MTEKNAMIKISAKETEITGGICQTTNNSRVT